MSADTSASNYGCKIVMDAPFGPSHCEICGRQWEALTPKGSENHCVRELGTRLALAESDRDQWKQRAEASERDAKRYRWLRNESAHASHKTPTVVSGYRGLDEYAEMLDGYELDAAIDAQLAALVGEGVRG